jgi:hypothetical protein
MIILGRIKGSELEGGNVSGNSDEEGGVGEVAAEDGESPRNENLSGDRNEAVIETSAI